MVRELTVLLKDWIIGDGELDVPVVGEQIRAGIGIDVENIEPARPGVDGVTPAPDLTSRRGAARAIMAGTAVVVRGTDGHPAFDVVTVQPGLHAVLLGSEFPAEIDSQAGGGVRPRRVRALPVG